MKKSNLMLVMVILALFSTLVAKPYSVDVKQDNQKIMVKFNLGEYNLEKVNHDGVDYTKINYDHQVRTERKGFAELPFLAVNLKIDNQKNVIVKVKDAKYQDIELTNPLLPARGTIYRNQDPSTVPYEIAEESIVDALYPEEEVSLSKPYIFRDLRGVSVFAQPFRYNAKKNVLRVYSSMELEVVYDNTSASINPLNRSNNKIVSDMNNIYSSIFANYEATREDLTIADFGEMLVIYTQRDQEAIQPYIQWKKEKGFIVHEELVETGTNVVDLVKEKYEANNNILFVQLVGDWADIKCDVIQGGAPTDPMIGCVAGDDYFIDLIVGRFSAKNPEDVTVQVGKAITYERNPEEDTAWYKSALGVGSNQGPGDDNEKDYEHLDVIRDDKLMPYGFETVYQDYDPNVTSAQVGTDVNSGVSLINYTGHGAVDAWGSSGFSNSNIASLTNGNKLPVIVSVACVNGAFQSSTDCFGEAWLKKENGGAAAGIFSTINQPWQPPMRGQDYFNDLLIGGYNYDDHSGQEGTNTTEGRVSFGSLVMNSFVLMYAESSGSSDLETIQTWTLFGDASLQVRSAEPREITVPSDPVYPSTPYEASFGSEFEGSIVSLFQNGIAYVGIINEDGNVSVQHDLQVGDAKMVITGKNLKTIYEDVQVLPPSGPYLVVDSFEIVDEEGENDADTGETFGITVTLKNVGVETSINPSAVLSTESEYVESINNANLNIGDLASDEIKTFTNAFNVTLTKRIEDQTPINFVLTMTDENGKKTYVSPKIKFKVNAPKFELEEVSYTGDEIVNPGDTRSFSFTLANKGHSASKGFGGELVQVSDLDLTIANAYQELGEVAIDGNVTFVTDITFGEGLNTGENPVFKLYFADNNGLMGSFDYSMIIGNPIIIEESFEGAFPPEGWTSEKWFKSPTTPAHGDYAAGVKYNHTGVAILTTPEVEIPAGSNLQLSFYWVDKDMNRIEGHDSTYCEISSDGGNTWEIKTVLAASTAEGSFHKDSISLAPYAGQNIKIRWRDVTDGTYNSYGTGVDLVEIKYAVQLGIEEEDPIIATDHVLYQNYPNPFNPETKINFYLASAQKINLSVFNYKGQKVAELAKGAFKKGLHSVRFNALNLTSGVYFYKLEGSNFTRTNKMILVK